MCSIQDTLLLKQGHEASAEMCIRDSVWTVEPWVSRLVMTAGGKVLVDEKESIATVLVCGCLLYTSLQKYVSCYRRSTIP